MHDERPISFVGTTTAGGESEQVHEFDQPGVITGAEIVTHSGQEYALQNHAVIIRSGSETSLWQPLDEAYLAGDGEDFSLPLRFEVERGDKLKLRANNTSSQYQYHHNMTIAVDYATSVHDRVTSALRRVL